MSVHHFNISRFHPKHNPGSSSHAVR